MTQMGALPISFDIEADNLAAAVANYREAAKAGVEKTMKELQELRRAAASKIVVPGQPGLYASGRCRRQRLSYAVIWS